MLNLAFFYKDEILNNTNQSQKLRVFLLIIIANNTKAKANLFPLTLENYATSKRPMIAEQEAAQAKQKAEQLVERLRQLSVNTDEADKLL
ncbi:hypothetical protein [Nostoc sp. FACHB-133]|uniref:hypothetical protein n=1 Tax=Nostoc sp. FACHB-133 TaxID=2692835 RepID=UPI0024111D10|nr:hypothetical protein [Nostoc sp. FACHB-133]